ncbi:MAG: hypothetical protein JNK64_34545 [Myxococcales bacterium]|nr:hypothetical protein [Myxococcales bacterium]
MARRRAGSRVIGGRGAARRLVRGLLGLAPMRLAVIVLALLLVTRLTPPAHAGGAAPLRITIECQSGGRTKACPAFLRGFVDETPLMLASPRATAQVVLYVTAVGIANDDRLHLRFVGDVRGAPASIEVDVDLDTRADDDTQRGQLKPAFLRGVALFVAALHPDAVAIELTVPTADEVAPAATTPWGVALSLSGFGSWTRNYKSGNASGNLTVSRVEVDNRFKVTLGASGGLSRSPAVDGVSFDENHWGLSASTSYERHINGCYAYEVRSSMWRDDPHGQYRYGWHVGAGVEWDRYPSDEPRGNVLAVAYNVGYRVEGYNFRNVLGERFAQYPLHSLGAAASVRKDKVSFNVSVDVTAEMFHPARRYTLSASPGVEIQLGDHVDLSLDGSVTRRELPAFLIPDDDPQAIGRAEYAEPTSIYGSVSVRLHWDATNGAQNNRLVSF